MALYKITNHLGQYIGTYAAPNKLAAIRKATDQIISSKGDND